MTVGSDGQPMQALRCRSTDKVIHIPTLVDSKTGGRIVLWRDIQRAIKDAESIWKGSSLVRFITDENFEEITPLRITHHPDDVLEVDVGDTSYMPLSPKDSVITTHTAYHPDDALQMDKENSGRFQYGGESSIPTHTENFLVEETFVINQFLVEYSVNTVKETQSMVLAQNQSTNAELQTLMSGQAAIMQTMNQKFDSLQFEMEKNKELHGQLIQMQDCMLQMQQQTLDRLAIIQSNVQALVTQTYGLHEYPIPRLFIVLPKTLGLSGKIKSIIADQFRLYFLCECGTHTMSEDTRIPHQIHLAKHEGYDLDKPSVFFERYGSYVLTVMHMIKYGITAAGLVVPPLANSKIIDGIDTVQKQLDYLKRNFAPLVDDAIRFLSDTKSNQKLGEELIEDHEGFEKLEALEGADLRQLESYLKIKDQGRVLGNLYRIVTSEGHVKWVCLDHYRENYRETAIVQLREIVGFNDGNYIEETGSIKISLGTHTLAKQFYDAMTKARCIQELDVTLGWDATMDELRKLAVAVTKANVVSLTVNGGFLQNSVLDVVYRTRRFDPIMLLASNARIQSLQIKDFDNFFARVSKSALTTSSILRVLSVDSELPLKDKAKSIDGFSKRYPGLTSLEVRLNDQSSIVKAISDISKGFPKLESLKIVCGLLTAKASVEKGKVQYVVLRAYTINLIEMNDIEDIRKDHSCKMLIKVTHDNDDWSRLPDAFQIPRDNRFQGKNNKDRPTIVLATSEWRLRELMEVISSEFPEELKSFSTKLPQLSVVARFLQGKRRDVAVTIERLGSINSDDLTYIQEGLLTQLVVKQTPREEDKDRLADILRHNRALKQLEIEYRKEQDSAIGNAAVMKFLDILTLVRSNASSNIKSFSISHRCLSLTTRYSKDRTKILAVAVTRVSEIGSGELAYIQKGHLTRLEIADTPLKTDEARMAQILKASAAEFHLQIGRNEWRPSASSKHEMKLWELVRMATSNNVYKIESLKVNYWGLYVTTSVIQGNVQDPSVPIDCVPQNLTTDRVTENWTVGRHTGNVLDPTLTIGRLKDLTLGVLDTIQWDTFSRLLVRSTVKWPAEEPPRLYEVRMTAVHAYSDLFGTNIAERFSCIQFDRGEKRLAIITAPERKLQDLVVMATSVPLEAPRFSIDCPRLHLTANISRGKIQYMAMTIKRLDCLNSDDLKFIQQGHLSRLTINEALQEADEDRLFKIKRSCPSLKVMYKK